jgi:hypothetical protein
MLDQYRLTLPSTSFTLEQIFSACHNCLISPTTSLSEKQEKLNLMFTLYGQVKALEENDPKMYNVPPSTHHQVSQAVVLSSASKSEELSHRLTSDIKEQIWIYLGRNFKLPSKTINAILHTYGSYLITNTTQLLSYLHLAESSGRLNCEPVQQGLFKATFNLSEKSFQEKLKMALDWKQRLARKCGIVSLHPRVTEFMIHRALDPNGSLPLALRIYSESIDQGLFTHLSPVTTKRLFKNLLRNGPPNAGQAQVVEKFLYTQEPAASISLTDQNLPNLVLALRILDKNSSLNQLKMRFEKAQSTLSRGKVKKLNLAFGYELSTPTSSQ